MYSDWSRIVMSKDSETVVFNIKSDHFMLEYSGQLKVFRERHTIQELDGIVGWYLTEGFKITSVST